LAETPLAVISSDQVESSATNLLVSYVNAGDVSMYGADFSIQAFLDDHWTLSSTASLVSDDYFDLTEMANGISPIALNAPKLKGTFGLAYRDVRAGFNAETRLRLTSGFPAESAGFVGTQCETGLTGALYEEPCVDGYQLVDVTVGYKVPGTLATLQLVVNNLFNTPYRSFVGVPEIGRFIMVQAKYDLF
jgi:outer membrane receptor protein involved in Fe transport